MSQQHGPSCPCATCQERVREWAVEEKVQSQERERDYWQRQAERVEAAESRDQDNPRRA